MGFNKTFEKGVKEYFFQNYLSGRPVLTFVTKCTRFIRETFLLVYIYFDAIRLDDKRLWAVLD